ncbi:MAG: Fe-S cluster assembly protein IscX [Gammaproteobacteria bacterium]|nr:Fe-S cluster assembly protein IscX [Gammaproteobacteria bacterium]MDB2445331.1 Fe-S cluster assembly protein IscX [Gammaproteobacteria bacterium]MDG0997359.1 Fe-S cluster assembly protein IscX [Gammaproteobacteria bacterium]MDG1950987.1 Fe-S cluster assembly protein IscX [Gammaproteobacteria bacterium]
MLWTDVIEIAIELYEKYPAQDPRYIGFVDLHNLICQLESFEDDSSRGGEKVLEAIQAAWIEEASE